MNINVPAIKIIKWFFAVATLVMAITVFVFPERSFLLGWVLLFLSLYMFCLYMDLRIHPNSKQTYSSMISLIIVGSINFVVGVIVLLNN